MPRSSATTTTAQYTALHDALFDGWAGEQPLDDQLADAWTC